MDSHGEFGHIMSFLLPGFVAGGQKHGGGGYTAKAVHFDGDTWLENTSLTATDSNFFSFSVWFRNTTTSNMNYGLLFVVDSENNYTTFFDFQGAAPDTALVLQMSMEDEAGSKGVNTHYAPGTDTDMNWHHLLFSGETGQTSGSNARKLFLDDVDVGTLTSDQGPFQMVFNGKSFWFGADSFGGGPGSGILGDIADAWIAPNVNLISGGTIPVGTRRKFISASMKPVDLGSDGSTPTGAAPAIFLSGDHSSFGSNKGTGGSFALTGTLTDAASSPS